MRIQKIIENIDSIFHDSNGIFISKADGFYDIDERLLQTGNYFNNSNCYVYGYEEEFTIVKLENEFKKITFGYTSGCTVFSPESIICYKLKLKDNEVDYQLVNKNNKSDFSLSGRNIPIKFFKDKITFTDRKHQIFLYDLIGNNILWKHTLLGGFKIHGSVQVIDDVLFFIAYKDNHYQLVTGLDLETGEIIYQNQYEVTTANKFIAANAYNLTDKLFYGLGYIYQVFNPKTGEIVLEKSATECKSQEVEPYTNTVYNNKLWFVSGKYEEVKFGYLNIDTHEVKFTQDFPQEKDEIFEAPIYHNGSLYLRGKLYNNLYILE